MDYSEKSSSNPGQVFETIYQHGLWGKNSLGEGTSGFGSTLIQGWNFILTVQYLLNTQNIQKIVDVGCGDWVLAREIDWGNRNYLGVDIVKSVIEKNQKQYSSKNINFLHANAIESLVPKCDLIICRDVLVHLPLKAIAQMIHLFKKSGSTYLLTTSFSNRTSNNEIVTGLWRPINLMAPPFNLCTPEFLFTEDCIECGGAYADKACAVWKLENIHELNF
jgi:SAM-dependent methyltransferase